MDLSCLPAQFSKRGSKLQSTDLDVLACLGKGGLPEQASFNDEYQIEVVQG